jgi:lipopolysaccharide transport system ATP-binding protein
MDDVVIRVDGLSKQYRIGVKLDGYKTLRETLTDGFVAPFRRTMKLLRGQASGAADMDEKIWALKDVSFEIKRGEVVGIIGRNGAGKTTLLKILSRITEPTEGCAEIHGRIGSLLEVGTGFHPELTGRENIYLNGAILGMKKRQMDRKFDEIVAFAEIEKFIDTPVKHYSSGMYVRLAFAVAAHLEPEILLVDEVLAVGDAAFQKKCLGKMGEVAEGGRTVLFVSHNMAAVRNLCNKSIVLENGQRLFTGRTYDAISHYNKTIKPTRDNYDLTDIESRTGTGELRFIRYSIEDNTGKDTGYAVSGQGLKINLFYEAHENIKNVNVGIAIFTNEGVRLSSLATSLLNKKFPEIPRKGKFVFEISKVPLNAGLYSILVDANKEGTVLDRIEDAFLLNVEEGDFWGKGKLSTPSNPLLVDFDVNMEEI